MTGFELEGVDDMNIDTATRIMKALIADITDRRGWRQAWDTFDDDVQEEIKATFINIIMKEGESCVKD